MACLSTLLDKGTTPSLSSLSLCLFSYRIHLSDTCSSEKRKKTPPSSLFFSCRHVPLPLDPNQIICTSLRFLALMTSAFMWRRRSTCSFLISLEFLTTSIFSSSNSSRSLRFQTLRSSTDPFWRRFWLRSRRRQRRRRMALFRRLFYRKPPDRLLEISERVYGTSFFLSSDLELIWVSLEVFLINSSHFTSPFSVSAFADCFSDVDYLCEVDFDLFSSVLVRIYGSMLCLVVGELRSCGIEVVLVNVLGRRSLTLRI